MIEFQQLCALARALEDLDSMYVVEDKLEMLQITYGDRSARIYWREEKPGNPFTRTGWAVVLREQGREGESCWIKDLPHLLDTLHWVSEG